MELLYSILLFVLLAGGTTVLGVRLWARPRAAIERVTGQLANPIERMPIHPSLMFRDMVARLGGSLPVPGQANTRLLRLLIRAGYRRPEAVRVVYGAKALLALALPLLAWALLSRFPVANDTQSMIIVGAAVLGYSTPGLFVSFQARRRQRRIRRGLPDALDLLVICVESGLGLDQAIMQAAKEMELAHPDISREFAMVNRELKTGTRRADALRNLAARTAVDELKKLVAVLIQADRFGTGVAQSLRTHADYMRVQSRQVAEEKAAKVGVKLVFPIFFCILPTLFVVTVGPMAVRLVRELLPMMNNL
jgi:tight adherence protein C